MCSKEEEDEGIASTIKEFSSGILEIEKVKLELAKRILVSEEREEDDDEG